MNSIELKNIHFNINKQIILEDVSLSIKESECIAITGENGSGKSTLLKIIAGFVPIAKGKVERSLQKIGYVPERPPSLLRFTPIEYLKHMGEIAGLNHNLLDSRIEALILQFGIEAYKNIRIQNLSKGNKQKVNIMQAILNTPELLLLDEPLSGLDPESQKELANILLGLKNEGITIIFTCHESYLQGKIADRTIHVASRQIEEVKEVEIKEYYRSIEFFGASTIFLPFIQNSVRIINHVHNDSTHELIVNSSMTDETLREIIALGGSIRYVSRELANLPIIEKIN